MAETSAIPVLRTRKLYIRNRPHMAQLASLDRVGPRQAKLWLSQADVVAAMRKNACLWSNISGRRCGSIAICNTDSEGQILEINE